MANKLKDEIVSYIAGKLEISKKTVRNGISLLRRSNASLPLNCVAHLYAQSHDLSVLQKLTQDEKSALPNTELQKHKVKIVQKPKVVREKIKELFKYETTNYFILGHIKELNKAYTKGCYISTYILSRKIIENLIIDILRNKFPENNKINKELYYDTAQKRYKDFGVILSNLFSKRNEFKISASKAIQRLNQLALKFKTDANDKTHSWFHLVKSPKEIDDLQLELMIELIKTIQKDE